MEKRTNNMSVSQLSIVDYAKAMADVIKFDDICTPQGKLFLSAWLFAYLRRIYSSVYLENEYPWPDKTPIYSNSSSHSIGLFEFFDDHVDNIESLCRQSIKFALKNEWLEIAEYATLGSYSTQGWRFWRKLRIRCALSSSIKQMVVKVKGNKQPPPEFPFDSDYTALTKRIEETESRIAPMNNNKSTFVTEWVPTLKQLDPKVAQNDENDDKQPTSSVSAASTEQEKALAIHAKANLSEPTENNANSSKSELLEPVSTKKAGNTNLLSSATSSMSTSSKEFHRIGAFNSEVRAFSVPKTGNPDEDNDDAKAIDSTKGIYAIADGATTTSYAGQWARILAESAVLNPIAIIANPPEALDKWLSPLQNLWDDGIPWDRLNQSWYAADVAKKGACATVIALCITQCEGNAKWNAVGIGDSCFILIRQDQVICKGPITDAKNFDSTPVLIRSIGSNAGLANKVWSASGVFEDGDVVLLATDALAHWIYEQTEREERPWHILSGITNNVEFGQFVLSEQKANRLKNDDTTLILIAIHTEPKTGN